MKKLVNNHSLEIVRDIYFIDYDKFKFPIIKFKKNEIILREGDRIDFLYFVISGKLKVFQNYENGKTILLRIFDSFTILGDIEYFLDKPVYSTVQAVDNVRIMKVSKEYIDKHCRTNKTFLENMLQHISRKILLTNQQTTLNLMYSLDTRLASYILSMEEKQTMTAYMPSLVDVSNHLGTSYRHLHRTLNKFLEEKLIMKEKNKIVILDKEKLLEVARGNIYESEDNYVVQG
jgi:CRP-like cAMP-binding protein